MTKVEEAQLGGRWFGYRAEVALQLAALVIVAVSIVIALVVDPRPLQTLAFAIAVGILTAATLLAVVVGRTESAWLLAVPVLDMLALIVMMQFPEHHVHPLSVLAVLPALWLGWSGRPAFAGLAVLLSLGLIDIPGADVEHASLDLDHALRNFLTPAIVTIAAASTFVASRRAASSIRSLVQQDRVTTAALAREKHTAEVLDAILDAIDIGVVAFGSDGNQILANRTVLKHPVIAATGLSPLELDQQGYMLQGDRTTPVPADRGLVVRALRGDEYSNQIVWVGAPGSRQYALTVSARPVVGAQGEFAGTVIAIDDVTSYLETIDAKDRFVGSMSHEFRTPLASIVGYLELVLEDDRLPGDVRDHLQVIERNANRLQRLVNDLLETASRDRDAVTLQRESTDLSALCADVLTRCEPVAATSKIQLDLVTPGPVLAVVNPGRVNQAIDNLVSNAMKFSPFGGRVGVTVATDGDVVTITVLDSGMGIPPDEMEALASPFYRATTSMSAHFPGVGLGLAVTKSIIEEHRGSLAFESAVGHGTTVTVTLPVR